MSGDWRVEMESGEWRVESGDWRLVVSGEW